MRFYVAFLSTRTPGITTLGIRTLAGSAKANGREPKTGLGRVFNFKSGCFDDVHILIYADTLPHL
jgi:hypothetical protein